jgi:hypothetical protein
MPNDERLFMLQGNTVNVRPGISLIAGRSLLFQCLGVLD